MFAGFRCLTTVISAVWLVLDGYMKINNLEVRCSVRFWKQIIRWKSQNSWSSLVDRWFTHYWRPFASVCFIYPERWETEKASRWPSHDLETIRGIVGHEPESWFFMVVGGRGTARAPTPRQENDYDSQPKPFAKRAHLQGSSFPQPERSEDCA